MNINPIQKLKNAFIIIKQYIVGENIIGAPKMQNNYGAFNLVAML